MTMMMAGCVMAAVVMMTLMISQSSYSVHCRSFFTFHRYLAPEQEGDLRHIHSRPSMIYTSRNTLRDSRGVMTLSMGYLPPCFHAACPLRIIFIIGVLVGSPSSMVTRTLDSSFLSGGISSCLCMRRNTLPQAYRWFAGPFLPRPTRAF